jgi:hypothetical protein
LIKRASRAAHEERMAGRSVLFEMGSVQRLRTSAGTKNIEDIQEGDIVLSKDDETGEFSLQPVTQTFVNHDKDLLDLEVVSLDGITQHIFATPEHPFWVEGKGWTPAGELKGEDHTSVADAGGWATVRSVRGPPGKHTTYNFEVANTHTYFVGQVPTWVHNSCSWEQIRKLIESSMLSMRWTPQAVQVENAKLTALGRPLNNNQVDALLTTNPILFRCQPCAEKAFLTLEDLGVNAQFYKVTGAYEHAGSFSPAFGNIIAMTRSGTHWVTTTTINHTLFVFDNIHPRGIQATQWLQGAQMIGNNLVFKLVAETPK